MVDLRISLPSALWQWPKAFVLEEASRFISPLIILMTFYTLYASYKVLLMRMVINIYNSSLPLSNARHASSGSLLLATLINTLL